MNYGNNENVGSIGSLRPEYNALNSRVKGWVLRGSAIDIIYNDQTQIRETVDQSYETASNNGASRIMLRAIVESGRNIEEYHGIREEARIPLKGRYSGLDLVYLGRNFEPRQTPRRILEQEEKILRDCIERGASARNDKDVRGAANYDIESLTEPNKQDVKDIRATMIQTYERNGRVIMWYEPSIENMTEILENSVTAVGRMDNKIVSVALAEEAELPTEMGNFRMYEVSDCATLKEHRRRGLNQACVNLLLKTILNNHADNINMEARACNIGINQSMINIGFLHAGFIQRHVFIGGDRDIYFPGDLEDFNVLYYPIERRR